MEWYKKYVHLTVYHCKKWFWVFILISKLLPKRKELVLKASGNAKKKKLCKMTLNFLLLFMTLSRPALSDSTPHRNNIISLPRKWTAMLTRAHLLQRSGFDTSSGLFGPSFIFLLLTLTARPTTQRHLTCDEYLCHPYPSMFTYSVLAPTSDNSNHHQSNTEV